ncbi:MAG: bifunctional folylpolyglutamate synthase/dihydrofolate synthase [Lewinellaceae bacterium]|nr:bifunctional folylpolyglutamate synthase/dihydrofolate synthase [Lewinellaceae bacterium]
MTAFATLYKETLDYIYQKLPMFQRVGKAAFKKDLTNIRALLAHLKHPEKEFPSIHIAGTNGKGSTAHLLAAILQAHGLKTGLYISPHYKDFRERIKIDGQFIRPKEVVDFVERHRELIETLQPSFFEITVAMAFDHFCRQKVDVAVVETGLGGRLDSTNVIRPLLSIITNIGYDHMDMLGDTLPLIAAEKAGIIKSGVPVVIGEWQEETQPVFEQKARQERSPLFLASQTYRAELIASDHRYNTYQVWENNRLKYDQLQVETGGPYQSRNLATVLQAWSVLQMSWPGVRWDEDLLREGLKNLKKSTYFIGRWQQLGEDPLILCDSAHNQHGFEAIMNRLLSLPCERLHILLGFSNDKDIEKLLTYFPQHATYYFAKADIPRGMDASELKQRAGALGLRGRAYSSVPNAFRAARRAANPKDVIFVGGSIFVVGEVL